MARKLNEENIVTKFVDSFFDAYKKGVEKHFIDKSAERNPEVAKALKDTVSNLEDLEQLLAKLAKK